MALIGQHQQTSFANPQNGQAPDADVIRANDNAVTAKHNAHDADATIHVQTGLLSARPAAGTAGAVYVDENRRFYVDNGSAWAEVPYARLDAAGTNSFTNNVTVGGTLTVTTGLTDVMNVDAANIIADSVTTGAVAATSVNVSGTATAVSFSGAGTGLTGIPAGQLTGALPAISGANLTGIAAANLSGTTLASGVTGSSLTSVGTLTGLTMSGAGTANLQDGVLQRPRLQDYGEVRTTPSISGGTLTLNLESSNVFTVSLNANITTLTIQNPSATGTACSFTLALVHDGSARTVTWPPAVRWANAIVPVLTTTTPNSVDIFTFVTWDAGTNWFGFIAGQNF